MTLADVSPPGTPGLPRLIGRDRELAQLERVRQAAAAGSGAAAVIRGEAGIGKTRLANELRVPPALTTRTNSAAAFRKPDATSRLASPSSRSVPASMSWPGTSTRPSV